MGLFFSLLRFVCGPTIRPIAYASSNKATREQIKSGMRLAILSEINRGFNHNHKALNDDGSISLYINVKTQFTHGTVVYKLTDANNPDLMAFYRAIVTEYVTNYNESDEIYVSHRPNQNYRLSLAYLTLLYHSLLRISLVIIYTPPPAPRPEVRPVLTPHVAHLLTQALPVGSTCPVTYEPYTELPQLCVSFCGHVFSSVVASQMTCPLCRSPTEWTTVTRESINA